MGTGGRPPAHRRSPRGRGAPRLTPTRLALRGLAHGPSDEARDARRSVPGTCPQGLLPLRERCLGPGMQAPVAWLLHGLHGWLAISFWNLLGLLGKRARCLQGLVLSGSRSL